MYAAILLTSVCSAGYQPPAAAAPPPAAPVVAAAPGGGCVSTCADSCRRASLLDRIRARTHGHHHGHGCGCESTPRCHVHAPREHHTWHAAKSCHACEAPACGPTCHASRFGGHGHKAASCDSCPKATLLDRLKAKFAGHGHKSSCCDSCGTSTCGGCDTAPAPAPAPAASAPAPLPMGDKK